MTTTYLDLKAQIKALEEKAEAARIAEIESVIADLKNKITEYGISAEDLGFSQIAPVVTVAKSKPIAQKIAESLDGNTTPKVKKPVAAKYKDANGNEWTGRGIKPKWLATALAEGKTLEEFLIVKPQ